MLLGVCPKWTVSVRCVRHCDVHVLHQILFIAANEMRGSEEEREAQCLLALLKGRWQEERAVLAWPLFHGFDSFCAVRMTLRPGHFSAESQTPTANHRFQTEAASKKTTSPSIQTQPLSCTFPLDARVEESAKCSADRSADCCADCSVDRSADCCRIICRVLCPMASTALLDRSVECSAECSA